MAPGVGAGRALIEDDASVVDDAALEARGRALQDTAAHDRVGQAVRAAQDQRSVARLDQGPRTANRAGIGRVAALIDRQRAAAQRNRAARAESVPTVWL